ncbi:MAG TPA: glycoside hydrolase family 13 [Chloroflexi bacterium]|nr:glycoside hydrolase family 13 [Chloroflexota bacterium]
MIHKDFVQSGSRHVARITFTLPACVWTDTVNLVGDFNNWHHSSHPFRRERDGQWSLTIDLEAGPAYQFCYLLDGKEWTSEQQADAFVRDSYGRSSFVVLTEFGAEAPRAAA